MQGIEHGGIERHFVAAGLLLGLIGERAAEGVQPAARFWVSSRLVVPRAVGLKKVSFPPAIMILSGRYSTPAGARNPASPLPPLPPG